MTRILPALLLLVMLPACGSGDGGMVDTTRKAGDRRAMLPAESAPAPGTAAPAAEFVERAVHEDLFESEASRIALQRAQSPEAKSVAAQLIDAHGIVPDLARVLPASGVRMRLPTATDAARARRISALLNANPAAFDHLYLDQQEQAHEDTLLLVQTYAAVGDNPELRGFAGNIAPRIGAHLEAIRRAQEAVAPADDPVETIVG